MNDYISRQEVIGIIREMFIDRPLDSDRYVLSDVKERLRNTPSADVRENWRGEWLYDEDSGYVFCDKCHYGFSEKSNFCPNCGSDNRGKPE